MSSAATAVRAPSRPAARTTARPPRPRLRVVAPAPRRSRAGLAVLCVSMLGLGLLLLLLLNISLSRGSYQIYAQQAELEQLTEQRQALQEDLDARRAPQQLAEQAVRLGMVPSGNPAYLRLSDGKVLGKARKADAAAAQTRGEHSRQRADRPGTERSSERAEKAKTEKAKAEQAKRTERTEQRRQRQRTEQDRERAESGGDSP